MHGMTYPKPAYINCPKCRCPLVWDQWTHTTADHNGEPQESTGVALYCENKDCFHRTEPVDESELAEEIATDFVS